MTEIKCHETVKPSYSAGVSPENKKLAESNLSTVRGPFKDEIVVAQTPSISTLTTEQKIALPPAAPSYLASLTEAYEAIFNVMSTTVISQINDQNNLQQLDLAMNQIVTDSINNAVVQEKETNDKIINYQNEAQKQMKEAAKWGEIFQYIGIFLFIGSLLLAIPTGGASAPLTEESFELTDLTETESASSSGTQLSTFNSSSEVSSNALSDAESTSDSTGAEEEDDAPDYMKQTKDLMDKPLKQIDEPIDDDESSEESDESQAPDYMKTTESMMRGTQNLSYDQIEEDTADDLQQSDENVQTSASNAKKFATYLGKALSGASIGAVNSIPMILKGKVSLVQSHYMDIISNLTKALGTPMALMQENSMYFQFYQQLVQRGTSYIQGLAEETAQVVELDGSVMGLYRQTAVNLAQSA